MKWKNGLSPVLCRLIYAFALLSAWNIQPIPNLSVMSPNVPKNSSVKGWRTFDDQKSGSGLHLPYHLRASESCSSHPGFRASHKSMCSCFLCACGAPVWECGRCALACGERTSSTFPSKMLASEPSQVRQQLVRSSDPGFDDSLLDNQ